MRFQKCPLSRGRGLKEVAPTFQQPFIFKRERQEQLFCTNLDVLLPFYFYDDKLAFPSSSLNFQQRHSLCTAAPSPETKSQKGEKGLLLQFFLRGGGQSVHRLWCHSVNVQSMDMEARVRAYKPQN